MPKLEIQIGQTWQYQWNIILFEHMQLGLIRGGVISEAFCIGALMTVYNERLCLYTVLMQHLRYRFAAFLNCSHSKVI